MYGLTPRQYELLIYLSEREVCPSYDEMRNALGLASKANIYRLVEGLERRGYIERLPRCARSIRVIRLPDRREVSRDFMASQWEVVHVPLVGRINTNEDDWKRDSTPGCLSARGSREPAPANLPVGAGDPFTKQGRN